VGLPYLTSKLIQIYFSCNNRSNRAEAQKKIYESIIAAYEAVEMQKDEDKHRNDELSNLDVFSNFKENPMEMSPQTPQPLPDMPHSPIIVALARSQSVNTGSPNENTKILKMLKQLNINYQKEKEALQSELTQLNTRLRDMSVDK
jgi:hypothetical protein